MIHPLPVRIRDGRGCQAHNIVRGEQYWSQAPIPRSVKVGGFAGPADEQGSLLNPRASGAHRGVSDSPSGVSGSMASTGACRVRHCAFDALPAANHAPHNADTGQPPRYTAPVHLSTPRNRPPARHRRGRSPSIVLLATAPMLRRWTPGPGGRRWETPRIVVPGDPASETGPR